MRTFWLAIALTITSYATLPEQNLLALVWQLVSDMWHVAELKVGEHSDFFHLIQAAKLVIC